MTITELRTRFVSGEYTPEAAVAQSLAVIAEKDGDIHAFLAVYEDAQKEATAATAQYAKEGADAPVLLGVPIAIKNNILIKGRKATGGSKILENYTATYDATIITRLQEAGAIIVGSTNMDEFAMGSSTENSAFGPTKNPVDTTRVPGGSSGGSAAAVAMGAVTVAIGTDTGGSIRQPASYCGITGLKPTYGRVSRYGIIAFASSLDQAGPMTRDVRDNALLLEAMAGHDAKDSTSLDLPVPEYSAAIENGFKKTNSLKGLRIGIAPDFFMDSLNLEVRAAVEAGIAKYKELGAEIVDIKFDKLKYGLPTYYIIAPSEASSNLARYDGVRYGQRDKEAETLLDLYLNSRAHFGPEVKRRIMLGVYALSSGYYDAYYKKAQQVRRLIAQDFETAFNSCDLILTPTAPATAFEFGSKSNDPIEMYLEDIMTVTANLAGIPGMSLNCGYNSKGMPIGMQLLAPALKEETIYNAAYAFESTTDFQKVPSLDAKLAAA